MSAVMHFNYCVRFDDWSVKTGVTKSPFYRLQDYLQEARRHGKRVIRYRITPPATKDIALAVEARVCSECADDVIPGHREWFRFDNTPVDGPYGHKMPEWLAGLPFDCMDVEWYRHNEHQLLIEKAAALVASIREHRPYRETRLTAYSEVIQFAEELGHSAERISARNSTILAAKMVRA